VSKYGEKNGKGLTGVKDGNQRWREKGERRELFEGNEEKKKKLEREKTSSGKGRIDTCSSLQKKASSEKKGSGENLKEKDGI